MSAKLCSALNGVISASLSPVIPNTDLNVYEELGAVLECLCTEEEMRHYEECVKVAVRLISHLQGVCASCHLKTMNATC